jgi:predicted MFS family arabinose efflux permease
VWLAGLGGYAAVFAIGGGAALLAVLPVLFLPDGRSEDQHSSLSTCLRRAELRRPLVMFAAAAAGGVVVAFLPSAVTAVVAVPALFVQNLAATAARWLAGRRVDRRGPNGMLAPAVLICAVGMSAAAFTSTPLAVLAGMAAFGAGFGLAQAATLGTGIFDPAAWCQRRPGARRPRLAATVFVVVATIPNRRGPVLSGPSQRGSAAGQRGLGDRAQIRTEVAREFFSAELADPTGCPGAGSHDRQAFAAANPDGRGL